MEWYYYPSAGPLAGKFRELPINKIYIPRMMENWAHLLTLPADIPAQEVMEEVNDSWDVARELFKPVRRVVRLDRIKADRVKYETGEVAAPPDLLEINPRGSIHLDRAIEKKLRGVNVHMRNLRLVPPEFRLIEPEDEVIEDTQKRTRFAKNLGKVVMPAAVPLNRLLAA